ncbi:MAG: MFS transporter [Bosea sp. (in: a-proteobacteria)]
MNATAQLEAGDRLARRNALILAVAQTFAGANATVIFATTSIVGAMLAPDPAYATAPVSVFVVGMAAGTLPTGAIARRYGRRASFMVGSGFGVLCGLLAMVAVLWASFPLLLVATFCGGFYAAVAQSFRFAAADTASPAFRPKAISWVMAGGVFAGVLGPQLVTLTMDLLQPYLFAASYLAQAAFALIAMGILSLVDIPKPPPVAGGGRPLKEIVLTQRFVIACACGVISYALMNLVMTAAPLAMKMCGHALKDSNLAIQWHVIAMYGPSFFTGSLIARFGTMRIVALGLVITAAAGIVGLMGITVAHFWIALILLGIGWNFGFIGASAMVTECHRPEERNKVQAFNDFLIFGTMAVGSFASGHVLTLYGWNWVNMIVFPPVAIGLALLIWRAMQLRTREAV